MALQCFLYHDKATRSIIQYDIHINDNLHRGIESCTKTIFPAKSMMGLIYGRHEDGVISKRVGPYE